MSWGKAPNPPEKILDRELPIPGLGGAWGKGDAGEGEADEAVPLLLEVLADVAVDVSGPLVGTLLELLAVPVLGLPDRLVPVLSDDPALSFILELSVPGPWPLQLVVKEENT
jgi:hypothetical protein